MESFDIKAAVIKILDDFGMSGVKAAEIMGVTHTTFRSKKNDNNTSHSFNKKNLEDLKKYIIEKTKAL